MEQKQHPSTKGYWWNKILIHKTRKNIKWQKIVAVIWSFSHVLFAQIFNDFLIQSSESESGQVIADNQSEWDSSKWKKSASNVSDVTENVMTYI